MRLRYCKILLVAVMALGLAACEYTRGNLIEIATRD